MKIDSFEIRLLMISVCFITKIWMVVLCVRVDVLLCWDRSVLIDFCCAFLLCSWVKMVFCWLCFLKWLSRILDLILVLWGFDRYFFYVLVGREWFYFTLNWYFWQAFAVLRRCCLKIGSILGFRVERQVGPTW